MNTDPRIDPYIAAAAPFARRILQRLRKLVRTGNPDAEETIKWGVPFFTYKGKLFASFAAFKAHAVFGFHHREMEKTVSKKLDRTGEAMGHFGRITGMDDLPPDNVLLELIRTAKALHDSGVPSRSKPKPKPALPVPADFANALKRKKQAASAWADFPPGARREYIEWITGAKKPETRSKRLATAIEWISEGKHRNWKYRNC
jgi:uncharacterized protein YdeI (YjbR/CyaY-like superfamily)